MLEIGPGTGVITKAILARGVAPEHLTLLEYDEDMAQHLAERFPSVRVVQGDAFDLDATLGKPPWLALWRHRFRPAAAQFSAGPAQVLHGRPGRRLVPGAPLIQFSYGTHAPVVPPPGYTVIRAALVWANIPPAKVWVYRKA